MWLGFLLALLMPLVVWAAADVQVSDDVLTAAWASREPKIICTDKANCWVFFIDSDADMSWCSSQNGGSSWEDTGGNDCVTHANNGNLLDAGTYESSDVYYDKWTNGDTGTLFHIVALEAATNDVLYWEFDPACGGCPSGCGGSCGSPTTVDVADTCTSVATIDRRNWIQITKHKTGRLSVPWNCSGAQQDYSVCDSGCWGDPNAWVDKDGGLWEGGGASASSDHILIQPNSADGDDNDLWVAFKDISADLYTWKEYDASAAAGAGTWIESSTIITGTTLSLSYIDMGCTWRHSDDAMLCTVWSDHVSATADLHYCEVTNVASGVATGITCSPSNPLSNVETNQDEGAQAGLFIDQTSDSLWACYFDGTNFLANVSTYCKQSLDDGNSWAARVEYDNPAAESDKRWLSVPKMTVGGEGLLLPLWSISGGGAADAAVNPTEAISFGGRYFFSTDAKEEKADGLQSD